MGQKNETAKLNLHTNTPYSSCNEKNRCQYKSTRTPVVQAVLQHHPNKKKT